MGRSTLTAFLLVALFGTAGVAHAQTPDSAAAQRGMGSMMQMGTMPDMMSACPMMTAMDRGPQAALEHADELELTEEQRRRLEELKDVLTAEQRAKLRELRGRQGMERMMRMMNMMRRMMDMMGEMGDSGMAMRDTTGRR